MPRTFVHGEAKPKTPEYSAWAAMISRCENKNNVGYKDYGGRGIRVCRRWRYSFINFLSDLGRKPSPAHSLERKNNNGNYAPSNVIWATEYVQKRNRRNNVFVTIDGKTKVLEDRAKSLGLTPGALAYRIKKQLPLQTPSHKKFIHFRGKSQLLIDWCREYALSYCAIHSRLKRGWTLKAALTTPIRR
jgi:hypothetical protein